MSRCLDLIYQRDGVVLKGNAAVPLLVGDQVGSAQPELARSLARLEVTRRAEVGRVDVRRLEDAESLFVLLSYGEVCFGQITRGNKCDAGRNLNQSGTSDDEPARRTSCLHC